MVRDAQVGELGGTVGELSRGGGKRDGPGGNAHIDFIDSSQGVGAPVIMSLVVGLCEDLGEFP